jgi:hypothetical protein
VDLDWIVLFKIAAGIFIAGIGLVSAVIGIYFRRVYHSIDLLFAEIKAANARMRRLERAIIRIDPKQTMVLEAE